MRGHLSVGMGQDLKRKARPPLVGLPQKIIAFSVIKASADIRFLAQPSNCFSFRKMFEQPFCRGMDSKSVKMRLNRIEILRVVISHAKGSFWLGWANFVAVYWQMQCLSFNFSIFFQTLGKTRERHLWLFPRWYWGLDFGRLKGLVPLHGATPNIHGSGSCC